MDNFLAPENLVRIAVPCYGSRVLPRFGQAREFFFAEVDPDARTLRGLRRCQWDLHDEPHLGRWLSRAGIVAVLCGGIHPRFQVALLAEGIEVVWGLRGEVEEVVRDWLRSESEPLGRGVRVGFETETRQIWRMVHGTCPWRKNQGDKT